MTLIFESHGRRSKPKDEIPLDMYSIKTWDRLLCQVGCGSCWCGREPGTPKSLHL